MNVKFL